MSTLLTFNEKPRSRKLCQHRVMLRVQNLTYRKNETLNKCRGLCLLKHNWERKTKSSNLKVGKLDVGRHVTGQHFLQQLHQKHLNSLGIDLEVKESLQDEEMVAPGLKLLVSLNQNHSAEIRRGLLLQKSLNSVFFVSGEVTQKQLCYLSNKRRKITRPSAISVTTELGPIQFGKSFILGLAWIWHNNEKEVVLSIG